MPQDLSLSAAELAWMLPDLDASLRGAGVRKVYDDGAQTLTLALRHKGENLFLVISAERGASRIHLVDTRGEAPAIPKGFTTLLRKHLIGARLSEVSQLSEDRLVALRFTKGKPEGQAGVLQWTLMAQLTSSTANLFLLNEASLLAGALLGRRRAGTPWSPPPPLSSPRKKQRRFLSDAPPLSQVSDYFSGTLPGWKRARELQLLRGALKKALKRVKRREEAVTRDLARAEEAPRLRQLADILAANFKALSKGDGSITLPDFFDEMRPVTIELEPSKAPRENIERYYKRARKLHRAVPHIEERLAEAWDQRARLEGCLEALEAPDASLEIARSQVEDLLPRRKASRARPREERLPFRAFQSAAGVPIWVGRGSKDNDQLTFQHSRGNDLWLHASGWAGSHVIVRLDKGRQVDPETLLDAATLAAHYSRARADTRIEVHYLLRKHIRKPKGAPPGRVSIANPKAITLALDEARLSRLMSSSKLP